MANFFSGRPAGVMQAPIRSPEQISSANQLLTQLTPQATQAFNFEPIAQAAMQRFQQSTLPSIQERFAGMNARRSSGYNQAVANAQGNLQQQLAGQQAQFGLQSQSNLAKLLGLGMAPQFENYYDPGSQSEFMKLLSSLLPMGIETALGGGIPWGSIGGSLGSLLMGRGGGQQQQMPQQMMSPNTTTRGVSPNYEQPTYNNLGMMQGYNF